MLVYIYGGSMVFNIALIMVFIPQYGYMAAAWITVASEALVLLVSGIATYYEINYSYRWGAEEIRDPWQWELLQTETKIIAEFGKQ